MSSGVEPQQQGQQASVVLTPTAQAVGFPAGLYLFNVRTATPKTFAGTGNLLFPALEVSAGPGQAPGNVEFVGLPAATSVWLFNVGDSAVVRIGPLGATLLLNSVRVAGDTQAFDIQVDRLDSQTVAQSPTQQAPGSPAPGPRPLKLQVGLHLLRHGDVEFIDSDWAGRAGGGVWIESFSVVPLESLTASDIEYKGLAANGFETPWLSNGASCGTRGVNIPLVGFAIRLKAQAAVNYDLEYSAAFRSGVVVGPLRNGVPCRSKAANDPLDAIQVRIVKRDKPVMASMSAEARSAVSGLSQNKAAKGPSFGKFREAAAPAVGKTAMKKAVVKTTVAKAAAAKTAAAKTSKPGSKSAVPASKKSSPQKSSVKAKSVRTSKPAAKPKKGGKPGGKRK